MQTIGYNTQYGIQLAQEGRKVEALAYLRHAVRTEPINAEVWLWLAHVTPDLAEYRNCVNQALILDPMHPTAQRMQQDLDFQGRGFSPPSLALNASQSLDRIQAGGRRRRRILVLLTAILLVLACGFITDRLAQDFEADDFNNLLPILSQSKQVQFAVGTEANAYGFRVEIPTTWYLADEGSPSWREQRDRLQTEFPDEASDPWQDLESDWGKVERNPRTGVWSETVAILETSSTRITPYFPTIPRLELVAVEDLTSNDCEMFRRQAGLDETNLTGEAGYISTQVKQREDQTCIYFNEFNETDGQNTVWRHIQLYISVGENSLAEWRLYLPEADYADIYQKAAETIIATLSETAPTTLATQEASE